MRSVRPPDDPARDHQPAVERRFATPLGERIEVRAKSTPDAAIFEVTNSCTKPIRDDELPRLFARFAQRDEPREDDVEGAGLGLAIVDSIMRLHGGVAQAESGDFGVRFTLRFPNTPILTGT